MSTPLRFDRVFSNHMVLQRDAKVPVWGTGQEGSPVEVRISSQVALAEVKDGRWEVELAPLAAGGPFELSVLTTEGYESRPTVLSDVMVGEVFLAGGQSNMEWLMKYTKGVDAETAYAFHPLIRYYDVPREPFEGAEWYEFGGEFRFFEWEVCTPESVARFSAAAYHFARSLHAALGVPVGILGCNWGATSASCWMSEEAMAEDPDTAVYLEEYEKAILEQGPGGYEKNYEAYRAQSRDFREMRRPDGPWFPPVGPRSFLRPAGLYRTMLRKTAPFAARGVIWYQGESDTPHGVAYRKLFARMIREWREDFCNPELAFLFVQLTSFSNGNEAGEDWPVLRESQRQVAEEVPGTAMVVSLDFGDRDDIHPQHKRPVGERLALCALRRIFGRDVEDSGPVLDGWSREGNRLRLLFTHCDFGLFLRGWMLSGFSAKSSDGKVVPLEAKIEGLSVIVGLADGFVATEVRYGWTNLFVPSLYNAHGLPASPFCISLQLKGSIP
jgi:sialate O-acetylesterase